MGGVPVLKPAGYPKAMGLSPKNLKAHRHRRLHPGNVPWGHGTTDEWGGGIRQRLGGVECGVWTVLPHESGSKATSPGFHPPPPTAITQHSGASYLLPLSQETLGRFKDSLPCRLRLLVKDHQPHVKSVKLNDPLQETPAAVWVQKLV
jgi:hypothetical protein